MKKKQKPNIADIIAILHPFPFPLDAPLALVSLDGKLIETNNN